MSVRFAEHGKQKGIGDILIFDNEKYAKEIPESLAREIIIAM